MSSGYINLAKRAKLTIPGIDEGQDPTTLPVDLVYPRDLFSAESAPFILFYAVDPTLPGKILDKMALYMPKQLSVQYGFDYSQGTNWYEAIDDTIHNIADVFNGGGVSNIAATAASLGLAAFGGAAAASSASGFIGKLVAGIGGGVKGFKTGTTGAIGQAINTNQKTLLNPHKAATFQGTQFRKHDFSFDLIARSKEESETIQKIIYTFKYHAHMDVDRQEQQSTFPYWPSAWHIGLFSPARKYLYNISTCHISGINIEYMAGGQRAFFSDTGAPVAVRISLQFLETELMTRQRIDQGY